MFMLMWSRFDFFFFSEELVYNLLCFFRYSFSFSLLSPFLLYINFLLSLLSPFLLYINFLLLSSLFTFIRNDRNDYVTVVFFYTIAFVSSDFPFIFLYFLGIYYFSVTFLCLPSLNPALGMGFDELSLPRFFFFPFVLKISCFFLT
ncbi:hypothetical protein NE237_019474 [Protea cynaroides]|uniref:Uncharacterized protein n=1 Tax=Protea cynaroides TaxID=273540 RepID=A0A9Q0GL50_9MAGN|nr:hypothetical protein NE237_019474 [Protea cynaroides]